MNAPMIEHDQEEARRKKVVLRDTQGRFAPGGGGGPGRAAGSSIGGRVIPGVSRAQGLAGKSSAILAAVDAGKVTAEAGAALLAGLSSCLYQSDLEELKTRVSALERAL